MKLTKSYLKKIIKEVNEEQKLRLNLANQLSDEIKKMGNGIESATRDDFYPDYNGFDIWISLEMTDVNYFPKGRPTSAFVFKNKSLSMKEIAKRIKKRITDFSNEKKIKFKGTIKCPKMIYDSEYPAGHERRNIGYRSNTIQVELWFPSFIKTENTLKENNAATYMKWIRLAEDPLDIVTVETDVEKDPLLTTHEKQVIKDMIAKKKKELHFLVPA